MTQLDLSLSIIPPPLLLLLLPAVEFMDATSMNLVEKHLHLHNPISSHDFYTLVETSGSHDQHDKEVGVAEYRLV